MAMMAITTSNSMSVKPDRCSNRRERCFMAQSEGGVKANVQVINRQSMDHHCKSLCLAHDPQHSPNHETVLRWPGIRKNHRYPAGQVVPS
jgi:hypothetical protein